MSNEQHKEIQRLKDIINRARTAFCCSESDDHQAALRTLEILDEGGPPPMRIHAIPLNDEHLHSAQLTCRCSPLLRGDGVIVHNAFDCREKLEMQNIQDVSDGWVLVGENF
jgi:hypothetical protein